MVSPSLGASSYCALAALPLRGVFYSRRIIGQSAHGGQSITGGLINQEMHYHRRLTLVQNKAHYGFA
jgi:hypothetical protein